MNDLSIRVDPDQTKEQLVALKSLHALFEHSKVEYWLFGGWAVDFHLGKITRSHDDLDIVIWLQDHSRVKRLMQAAGWVYEPVEKESGYTTFRFNGVRLELAYMTDGEDSWPPDSFTNLLLQLEGVKARTVTLESLKIDKAVYRENLEAVAKDAFDLDNLGKI